VDQRNKPFISSPNPVTDQRAEGEETDHKDLEHRPNDILENIRRVGKLRSLFPACGRRLNHLKVNRTKIAANQQSGDRTDQWRDSGQLGNDRENDTNDQDVFATAAICVSEDLFE
jgi:hypothetical protein